MSKHLFTIAAEDGDYREIKVMAEGHRQHVWNETTLVGVSRAGAKRLAAFVEEAGHVFLVSGGKHHPRLVGWEAE